ncbi:PQQ-binding-like beta-propeller repeat protein [Melioribacteraceae bacterium 4301-Me]|uniref:outer membrane protein assembly factor BamB family protein n=1 Tax=Pyranulibacter aquaticus TaxID=3163344 RepID=UPI003597156A
MMDSFKRFFLALILLSYYSVFCQTDTIRFAWLSDTHVGNPTGAQDLRNSVKDINSLHGIDFTIISGDITEMGTNEQLLLAKQILDSLNTKYYIIPGNHDCKWSESGATFFPKLWGNDRFVFQYKNFLFIGLHQGPIIKMGDGHWAPQDLRWLDSTLSNVPKQEKIFFVTHYPIDNSIDNWYEVLDRMKSYNIQAFLFGHGHKNATYDFEGIPGVMSRSNLRAKDSLGGYTIAEIVDDTIKFYEKTPLTSNKRYWYKIALGNHHYDKSFKLERPDFSVNERYPNVKEKWIFNSGFTNASSPAIWQNSVFTADASGKLYKLSLNDGNIQGTFEARGPIYSSPAISNNLVVFGSADSNIYCIDAETETIIWKIKTNAAVLGSPSIDNNIVYIGGSDRKFRAINLKTGEIIWSFDNLKGFVETKPLIYNNKVIFGAWDSYLYCLNKINGELLWKWEGDQKGVLYSPAACWPVAARNVVFIAAPDRKLTAINVNSGKQLWRTAKYQVRETIGISEDSTKIFIRTMRDSIIALPTKFETETVPQPLWVTNADFGYDINSAQLIEKDGVLFYGTKNGLLIALDSPTGKILWKHKIGVSVVNTITPLDKNRIVLNDIDGRTMLVECEGKR